MVHICSRISHVPTTICHGWEVALYQQDLVIPCSAVTSRRLGKYLMLTHRVDYTAYLPLSEKDFVSIHQLRLALLVLTRSQLPEGANVCTGRVQAVLGG